MEYIPAKTILSGYAANNSWFGSNYNMNLYKGCCHGCIYCDSRSECYRVERFDEVRAKENALITLERELKSKRKKGVVGMGAMSDPYNPYEADLELTRGALKLINRYGFGVSIATKSDLVVRDRDILKAIAQHSPVLVKITVTTASDDLCRQVEAHAPLSSQRLSAVQVLRESGLFAGLLMMPILPFIEDTPENISQIITLAYDRGARFIYPAFGVTLRSNQRDWFYEKIDKSFPGVREKYEKSFGNAYQCVSLNARKLWYLLKSECEKKNILYKMKDIITAYRYGYDEPQISMFDG